MTMLSGSMQACVCVYLDVCFLPVQQADKNKEPQTFSPSPTPSFPAPIQGEAP